MKVLLINGSPHREGSTYTALREIEDTLRDEGIATEIFWIGNRPISGCIACKQCEKTGRCAIDDSVNRCLDKASEADGFVFGSPVHFGSASGNMTSFMDRLLYADLRGNDNKNFRRKPAAAVVAVRRGGSSAALDQMNQYFSLRESTVYKGLHRVGI